MTDDTLSRLQPLDSSDLDQPVWRPDVVRKDVSKDYDDFKIEEEIARRKYDSLDNIYHFHNTVPPSSGDIHDYYSKDKIKLGRDFRKDLFFNLRPFEQKEYGKFRTIWEEEFKKKGFDLSDPDVQDLLDYHAGTSVLNKIQGSDENGPLKKYYYRKFHSKDWWYSDDFKDFGDELFDDVMDFSDDALDFLGIFDDIFGS